MPDEKPFTNLEVKLMLQRLEDKIDGFISTTQTLQKEVDNLKTFQTKAMTVWGIAITALSIAVTKLL